MAWIELHQSLWTHKKTIMMAALLDIDELYAAAHMSKLWTWALDNAPDGELSGLPNKVIAFGAGWKGDADQFVDALTSSKWIDLKKDQVYLHDWYDYAGRLLEKKEANKKRMREARATHVQRTNNARAGATKPNLTKPNQDDDDNARGNKPESPQINPESFYAAHKRVWGFECNPSQAQKLGVYIDQDGLEEPVVVRALERAALYSGGYQFSYITSILDNYFKSGARTLEQAIAVDAVFDAAKAAKSRGEPGSGQNTSRQQKQIDDLDRLIEEERNRGFSRSGGPV